jgi:small-conductance mechanosensitive channel
MVEVISQYLQNPWVVKTVSSILILIFLWLIRVLAISVTKRRTEDPAKLYHIRRAIVYAYAFVAVMLVGIIWIEGFKSIATFLGLVSAGLAVAMHDTIANLAGWIFIMSRRPFKVGDRIQIGTFSGDVIDTRLFQFSMIEIGNWVASDQSTGRIVHVPNSKALREPICNYETGFEYIWHEIPVLITFESNWKKAKEILSEIANRKAGHLSKGVQDQIRRAAMKYLIYFEYLTPIVYTTVQDSGVLLTLRYIVKPRLRRGSEQDIWEEVLTAFSEHEDISLAYPTTRFYSLNEQQQKANK